MPHREKDAQVEFAYVKLPRNDPCTHGSTY